MKYSTLAAFEKHLESAAPHHFAEIYLIFAKESFIRKVALERLIKLVLKEDVKSLSYHAFDAEKHPVEIVLQELQTFSFFSKKPLIVVQNVEFFDKSSILKLENYCSNPNRSACFVVVTSSLTRTSTFYKKLEKTGVVLDILEEKPWEKEKTMINWLSYAASKEHKQLSPQVSQLMIKRLGTDQALLASELAKLLCYIGDNQSILEKDVQAVCSVTNVETGWVLGEAIFRKDVTNALRMMKELLHEGSALIAILRQIRSQFQTGFQICSILMEGGTSAEVAQEFPYMKGMILERHIRQSQQYGTQSFKQGILAIDDVETQMKNSALEPEFLAERLIIKLTI